MQKLKFKPGDWVKRGNIKEPESFGHIGKITATIIHSPMQGVKRFMYYVLINGKEYLLDEITLKHYPYTHKEISVGWFRVSFFKLGKMFSVRLEISKGWNK